jgi:uncharacterized SAM-binding protein YcdF (DUF218 family)
MKRLLRTLIALLSIIIGITIIYIAVDIYLYAQKDETIQADAAIVLGAAAFGDEPSPVLRERVNHAVQLYEQKYVRKIIFTGGQGATGSAEESVIAARYADGLGIPSEDILIEKRSKNTRENLALASELGKDQGLGTFLIVSTPFHMKRAMSLAKDMGIEAKSSPTRSIKWISWYTKSRAFIQEIVSYTMYVILQL